MLDRDRDGALTASELQEFFLALLTCVATCTVGARGSPSDRLKVELAETATEMAHSVWLRAGRGLDAGPLPFADFRRALDTEPLLVP